MTHISFSELKNWTFCPFYHKLVNIDKLKGFAGNEYTAFGTAIHTICENKLLKKSVDAYEEFKFEFIVYSDILRNMFFCERFVLNNDIIPSAGQGVIAVQCRKEDDEIIKLLKEINDENTKISALAEKEVLKTLDGDCDTAIGVSSVIEDKKISIEAELFSIDGKKRYYIKSEKELNLATELGKEVGKILKERSKGSYKN